MSNKWKVLVPVAIVAVVAFVGYWMTVPRTAAPPAATPVSTTSAPPHAVSSGDPQADAIANDAITAADSEAQAAAAIQEEGTLAASADGDNQLMTGDYYAQQ